ncbi:MAG: hypothetical protein EOM67_01565 [Spirochaetia bacterium]|nr:hypothetical protein [Spirochaetia bacterium]
MNKQEILKTIHETEEKRDALNKELEEVRYDRSTSLACKDHHFRKIMDIREAGGDYSENRRLYLDMVSNLFDADLKLYVLHEEIEDLTVEINSLYGEIREFAS